MELCQASLEVPFRSARHAEIAANTLSVDRELSEFSKKSLTAKGNKLLIELVAKDPRGLRASLNGLLDLLVLVNSTIERFDIAYSQSSS